MAFVHGKNTIITIDGDDLSDFTNSTAFKRSADSHDVTCYGASGHEYAAGLTDGEITIEGIFDGDSATSPKATLAPLLGGANVAFVFKPDGTASGKPQSTCNVQVTAFETTAPVADMVSWSATLKISGAVTETAQSA